MLRKETGVRTPRIVHLWRQLRGGRQDPMGAAPRPQRDTGVNRTGRPASPHARRASPRRLPKHRLVKSFPKVNRKQQHLSLRIYVKTKFQFAMDLITATLVLSWEQTAFGENVTLSAAFSRDEEHALGPRDTDVCAAAGQLPLPPVSCSGASWPSQGPARNPTGASCVHPASGLRASWGDSGSRASFLESPPLSQTHSASAVLAA